MIREVDYPVDDLPIGLLGKPADWTRRWTLVPRQAGHYSLLVHPGKFIYRDYVYRVDFFFPPGRSEPVRVDMTIDRELRSIRDWEWRLVRHRVQERLDRDDVAGPMDDSELLFLPFPEIAGSFRLFETESFRKPRALVWSCHQPFDTHDEQLVLNPVAPEVLEWYRKQVERFDPDCIWGLGDTAYADGTEAGNFIDAFYEHPAWLETEDGVKALSDLYRRMYIGHWSFEPLQWIMRRYPHFCVWDDHEIRDGWGSEEEHFDDGRSRIFPIARGAANEFILEQGPRVRRPEDDPGADAHQAYVDGETAVFLFDGRSSRRYHEQKGHVLSEQQMADFESFCRTVAAQAPQVRFLVMGCAVPFINLQDYVEALAEAPKALTDLMAGIRDDLRDSWNSPGNQQQFKRLLGILEEFEESRPEVFLVNVSGDIHISSAFAFHPPRFSKALYQVTTSALTNREHPPEELAPLLYQDDVAFSETLGLINRLWVEVNEPNILFIEPGNGVLRCSLKVFDLEHDPDLPRALDGPKDQILEVGAHKYGLMYMV